ncbi:MAG TPA: DUF1214 domain-containing protein, partial [Oceanipulchritudo sp.]|nr:DUF1214 domain-containing protein [Oceanipulchritudo sp.]
MKTRHLSIVSGLACALTLFTSLLPNALIGAGTAPLSDQEIDNLVRRSYQYVAMYNVNNKFAMSQGGWNTIAADTRLKDHTMKDIARPNNDTLYIGAMLDVRQNPMILEIPAFDSTYVSLMVTAYDHYVNVPLSTRQGDFKKPIRILLYSARTEGYHGEPVEGIDRLFEVSGDFVSAVFRVMPHSKDPERFARIKEQMQSVRLIPLSLYKGGAAKPVEPVSFPQVGRTDGDIFENNLLEVMQFIFNHTTFDPANPLDQALLKAYQPLGIVPGQAYDPVRVTPIDGKRFRAVSESLIPVELARAADPDFKKYNLDKLFQRKGKMQLEFLLLQSIIGPIGLPAAEAVYPAISTSDGQPMNARHDYVIRMAADQMPPSRAFWSFTLYDTKNGFFIPNDHMKYSVGENAGMQLNQDGGIEIHVAAEKPAGIPEENWLPINRSDENIDVILRIYV